MASMTNLQGTNPVSSSMTNPSSSTTCPQQAAPNQHDLIRILAQHFNQQSYRSDGITPTGSTQPTSVLTTASNIDLLHQNTVHAQQPIMSQNALNLPLMNGRVDLAAAAAAACLMGTNSNDRTFLTSQLARSVNQAPLTSVPITTSNPMTASGPGIGHSLRPSRSEAQSSDPSTPLINDMNLFSALNYFNTNSDQFMLSLQQQYLIQMASAANRQYANKQNSLGTSLGLNNVYQFNQQQQHHFGELIQHHAEMLQEQHQQQQQRDVQTSQRSRRHLADQAASKKVANLIDSQVDEGRELLKFSISTILGRGSPVSGAQERSSPCSPSDRIDPVSSQNTAHMASGQPRQASSPECDPNVLTDFSSDSSSTNTPRLQSSSKSAVSFEHCDSRNTPSADLSARASSLADQVARYHQASTEQQRVALANQQHPSTLTFLAGSAPFPWTSTARGKPRRGMMRRAVFSDSQRVGLEKRFQLQKYISKPDRKKLAEKLGLRDSQVKIWFQNRRMKWRNSKERELLSAGGSREQTLPTRNNPNPDLSDVGETVKKSTSTTNSHTAT